MKALIMGGLHKTGLPLFVQFLLKRKTTLNNSKCRTIRGCFVCLLRDKSPSHTLVEQFLQ